MKNSILSSGEGKPLWLGGLSVDFIIEGSQTGGNFAVIEHPIVEPGRLVMPHMHLHTDECTYVIEGEIGVRVGDQVVVAKAGSYVFKPRGIPHAFWNAGPQPARLIEIISPAGFEQYFLELYTLLEAGANRDQLAEAATKYDVQPHPEWVDDLTSTYHVKLLGQ